MRRFRSFSMPIALTCALLIGRAATAADAKAVKPDAPKAVPVAVPPADVWKDLLAGNARFAAGKAQGPHRGTEDVRRLVAGQMPKAIIIACADSRVAPELVFDQGLGDLFVVREAGNVVIAGPVIEGSIEYAVEHIGTRLIVVLGHSKCGAVTAAVKQPADAPDAPGTIDDLARLIQTGIASAKAQTGDPIENAVIANVKYQMAKLAEMEPIVADGIREHKIQVVGAVYDLATGKVTPLAP